ncbi:MAG: type II toxin-antitoxin system Phd/YefM family antitoxin [Comamonadaceae bacterium]|nr:type II toxin-antitoxin system Phd/YefM family antitoxin [Comamonadaceae bacterium]
MSTTWPVQEAQSRFGEVIERALREGPQTVTQRGKPVVRVVALDAQTSPAAARQERPFHATSMQSALKRWRGKGIAGQSTEAIMRETRGDDWNCP